MIEIIVFLGVLREIIKPVNSFFNIPEKNQDTYQRANSVKAFVDINEFEKITPFIFDTSKISAKAVLIKEIAGPTIYAQNSDKNFPIASLTKILTALTAFTIFDQNEIFTIPKNYRYFDEQQNLLGGEFFKRDDLIKAMLISSSNVLAIVLSEKYGKEAFVAQMNNLARNIGLKNSFFEEPVGLSSKNTSSLNELYFLAEYILRTYPQIFEFSREPSFVLKGNFERIFYNTNPLVKKYKEEIIASKTGSTSKAGECLIMIIKLKNSPLVFVGILGSKDRISDAEYIIELLKKYYNQ